LFVRGRQCSLLGLGRGFRSFHGSLDWGDVGVIMSGVAIFRLGVIRKAIGRGVIGRGVIGRGVIGRGVIGRGVIGRGVIGRGVIGRGVIDRGVIGRGVIGRGVIGRGVIGRGVINLGALECAASLRRLSDSIASRGYLAGCLHGDEHRAVGFCCLGVNPAVAWTRDSVLALLVARHTLVDQ